jgi:aryl-alcohol dehydrogenase-like predicted oxidoreductase
VKYLEENAGALSVSLSAEEMQEIEHIFPPSAAAGDRYTDMSSVNR